MRAADDGTVWLHLFAHLDDLVQNFIEPGVVGVQSQLLGHEADGGVVDAVQLLDSGLHPGGAVGTVQINELKVLFHGKVSISL